MEFHLLLKEEETAAYFVEIWKLEKALRELQEFRTQLGGQKESGIKQAVAKAVEGRLSAMRMAVSECRI